jgi:hypothetical protein
VKKARLASLVVVAVSGLGLLMVLGAATPRGRSAPPPPPPPPAPQVDFTLTAPAPDRGWIVKLVNTGTDPVRIVADPRLFSFDVTSAGHEQHCTLPADMTPTTDTERTLVVPPGRSWSQRVDPLLYCFSTAQAAALAPGATVIANFGFSAGRYAPPFALTPTIASDAGVGPARRISAPVVTLAAPQSTDAGATFADASITINPPNAYPVNVKTSLPARLDVSRAFEQTVTVTIVNEGDRPVHSLIGPLTIGFVVEAPNGTSVRCGAERAIAAQPELVTTLAPRARSAQSIDIGAWCGAFMRAPGLYRVQPRVDTRRVAPPPHATSFWTGESIGEPMLMRVRNGDDPVPPPHLDPR